MVNPEQVSEIVQHFCGVTACNPEEAHFFLESCNWELDSAIHSFYENTGNSQPSSPLEEALPASNPVPPAAQLAPAPSRGPPPMAGKDKKSAKPTARGGIRTLSDLNRPSGSDSDDSDDPQEYYAGGEKSGMLVQDPSKGSNDVDSIFDGARRVGATEVPPDQLRPSSSSRVFSGVGRLLSGETVPSAPRPPEPIVHNITFWRNGFTVGDGPLRRLDDPENGPFLESIKKSECPKELEPADRRVPVHVNLIRREGDCPVQEQAYTPFQGVGRTLGASSSPVPAPSIPSRSQPDSSQPLRGLTVDDSKPSTSIQLRLSDGTRMVARFNYHHTIADIRAFIDAARPGGSSTYQLQAMGFPPKPLNDPMQTIEQAGLINSVVLQKL
ncbi:hypothetical protein SUGI_0610210 [Cryptomeria japonica]|uniref:plant UBX domain-containing protein 4 n=1 Tax=Cryptomeria japonica TaxID=3369 RepID=UPI0024147E67|nr:plant UBX domain-containing protein 4 [Cryptomeria japonica]GLJ30770.1 hypothetical protein SUGI_0610210 [Cryptomeria japonica]